VVVRAIIVGKKNHRQKKSINGITILCLCKITGPLKIILSVNNVGISLNQKIREKSDY